MEIDRTIPGCEQSRRDQLQHQEELSEQNRELCSNAGLAKTVEKGTVHHDT